MRCTPPFAKPGTCTLELEAVVLETDGSLTVMKRGDGGEAIVLSDGTVRVER